MHKEENPPQNLTNLCIVFLIRPYNLTNVKTKKEQVKSCRESESLTVSSGQANANKLPGCD